ncbi:hypothetical protein CVU82_01295 [Candidatus Falkowbacteria bacterium HGW-Falkowbacteria-1]|jgi:hypothetical protein|uniref:Protein kinase domain-containing protein n=1 Tax=Candidatus Falkowbacteria bacterium HGW-Falkowbacteria-1 TaxID=2013768 RepID=A0A2N2EAQ5_9BACT|nr:MAG: hypothetical protein CVU82_01295 [Candidatus Falkowbacteria bacterium HGW-Falkowbacteria-1]
MENIEKIKKIEKDPTYLSERLKDMGVDDYVLNKYKDLIENIEFININLDSHAGKVHLKMVGALFSRMENDKTFLKNIIKNVELEEVGKIDVSDYSSGEDADSEELFALTGMAAENIDLDIGTNRRVNKVDCYLKSGNCISFTLSADLHRVGDEESNSSQEKSVFESDFGQENPVLQKYYGYFKKDFDGQDSRFIAKEYLPGKNISHYLNGLSNNDESLLDISDLSSDLAYSMAYLYKKGNGELVSDLKLENIIYNYEDSNEVEYSCRVCDNSGFYSENQKRKSAYQILAHLQSLLSIFNNKKMLFLRDNKNVEIETKQEDVINAYLDSFLENLDAGSMAVFKNNIKDILNNPSDKDIFEIDKDILEYASDYLDFFK